MNNVKPAPWLIAVTPSEVDPHEEQRNSGLLVKHDHDHSESCSNRMKRGVITALGSKVTNPESGLEDLAVGDVIFYHHGITLRGQDYVYPTPDNMIGYESNG